MTNMWSILGSSAQAMGRIMGICVVGVFMARYPRAQPLLTPALLSSLSRLGYYALSPALTITTMSQMTVDEIGSLWVVLVWSCIQMAVAYALSVWACRVLRLSHLHSPVRARPCAPCQARAR